MLRKHFESIAYILALCVFVWLSEIWMHPPEGSLSVISKIAFVIASALQGFLLEAIAERANTKSAYDRFLRAFAFAAPWYLFMVILLNEPLPSVKLLIWLIAAAGVGYANQKEFKDRQTQSLAPTPLLQWLVLAVALAMIVLSVAPILQRTQDVLFALILAMAVVGAIAKPFAKRHWSEHIAYALSAVALTVGIFTA